MTDQKIWRDDELRYAARARCQCGAGLAYAPADPGSPDSVFKGPSAWDCSDILTGRAVPSGQPGAKMHDGPAPFAFYEIRSEDQPSADGETTRPEPPTGMPMLGKLPQEPDRPALMLAALAIPYALPTPPPEVHNIELVPDRDMLGNDVWPDCVFVMIENIRRIAAARLGVPITRLTAAQVIANYCAHTGATSANKGNGAVIDRALNWTRSLTAGWGGSHLLAFARVPITEQAIRQAVFEFQSVGLGVELRRSHEYPNRHWRRPANDPPLGGHAAAGGTETLALDYAKSWGVMVDMDPAFFSAYCDEIIVLIWDFQWESLTYERQVTLIADYQALTTKAWSGPAPIPPYEPRTAVNFTAIKPSRVFSGPLAAGASTEVQVSGVGEIPANAVAVTGNLTVATPGHGGYVSVLPAPDPSPTTSTLNFPLGDTRANGFTSGLSPAGKLTLRATTALHAAIVDITGYFTA
jgi:hypothetical protein